MLTLTLKFRMMRLTDQNKNRRPGVGRQISLAAFVIHSKDPQIVTLDIWHGGKLSSHCHAVCPGPGGITSDPLNSNAS